MTVQEAAALPVEERDNTAVKTCCSQCKEPLVTWAWFRDAGGVSCCWPCFQMRELKRDWA
jgi:hypothetical protein